MVELKADSKLASSIEFSISAQLFMNCGNINSSLRQGKLPDEGDEYAILPESFKVQADLEKFQISISPAEKLNSTQYNKVHATIKNFIESVRKKSEVLWVNKVSDPDNENDITNNTIRIEHKGMDFHHFLNAKAHIIKADNFTDLMNGVNPLLTGGGLKIKIPGQAK